MITLLAFIERISLYHTMAPFFLSRFRGMFTITQDVRWCLKHDRNKVLFMERWFKNDAPPDLELMKRLRERYKTIIYLDGYAAAGTHGLEVLPYVDHLYHKSIFTDFTNYQNELYAGRLFADYYHRKYQINDAEPPYTPILPPGGIHEGQLKLSWNIGLGTYPRRHLPQRIGVALARSGFLALGCGFGNGKAAKPSDFSSPRRSIPVHARLGMISSASVTHQRRLFQQRVEQDARFVTGMVPQDRYYAELGDSKIVLSPFGWGEICFRDFEALCAGALLMKPDLSHMDTWPNIYIPYETYIPVSWDAEDIIEKADQYLSNDAERMRIAQNAWELYMDQRLQLENRFEAFLNTVMPS